MTDPLKQRCEMAYGATRAVLLVGRYAIKIPSATTWKLFLLGLVANMQEVEFSMTGWPELCPVLWSVPGGLLVVMRRAQPITQEEFDAIQFPEWQDKGDYYVPIEAKRANMGRLDGRIVAVDYGN